MKELAFAAEEEKKEKDKQIELLDRSNKKHLQLKKQIEDLVSITCVFSSLYQITNCHCRITVILSPSPMQLLFKSPFIK